jgi:hypothetical protein
MMESDCASHGLVCLQEPVLYLFMAQSVKKSFVLHLEVSVYESLGCTYTCAFVLHIEDVCLQEPINGAHVGVYLQELLW